MTESTWVACDSPETAGKPAVVREPEAAKGADVAKDADAIFPLSAVSRNLDVVLVAVAVLPALALGAPELGVVLGSAGWIGQRMLAVMDKRWTGKVADPVKQLAINLFEAFGRIWLLAGVIVLAGVLGERQDGLAAAVVIIAAYSVAFVIRLLSGARGPRGVA